MLDSDSATVVILLCTCAGLLFLVLMSVIRLGGCVRRIEKHLGHGVAGEVAAPVPGISETSHGGAFETFLKEDPSRRGLSKSEQFAAYRRWRQENGLNWSNS